MLCLGTICYQDLKERKVFLFLFALLGLFLGILHYVHSNSTLFVTYVALNALLVTLILLLLYLYTKLVAKKKFINYSFGMGDLVFFYVMALGFPTFTFIVFFSMAIFFSLMVFMVAKRKFKMDTVPLAGIMSLFLILVFAYSMFFKAPPLYFF